jgi:hypothetical protein
MTVQDKQILIDQISAALAKARGQQECSNKYCCDGWVDHETGTQDGRESYVEQVPCRVCCVHCDPDEDQQVGECMMADCDKPLERLCFDHCVEVYYEDQNKEGLGDAHGVGSALITELTNALSDRAIAAHVAWPGHEQKWADCPFASCSDARELLERVTCKEDQKGGAGDG